MLWITGQVYGGRYQRCYMFGIHPEAPTASFWVGISQHVYILREACYRGFVLGYWGFSPRLN